MFQLFPFFQNQGGSEQQQRISPRAKQYKPQSQFNIVLGEYGSGKSSLINFLAGREVAKTSLTETGTSTIEAHPLGGHFEGTLFIDTPGFLDARFLANPGEGFMKTYEILRDFGKPKFKSLIICQSISRKRVAFSRILDVISAYKQERSCMILLTRFAQYDPEDDIETLTQVQKDNLLQFPVIQWDNKKPLPSQITEFAEVSRRIEPKPIDLNFLEALMEASYK